MTEDLYHFVTKLVMCQKQETKHYPWGHHKKYHFIITTSTGRHWFSTFRSLQWRLWIPASDHRSFTRFSQVYPTTSTRAKTAVKKLCSNSIMRYGIPEKLLSDRRREFENELFQWLPKLCSIKKIRTTPYHPQTNGQVEQMTQIIINMLKCLPEQYKSNGHNHVNKLVHAYNSTKSSATGYFPYYLLFGRHWRLPIDLLLLWQSNHKTS